MFNYASGFSARITPYLQLFIQYVNEELVTSQIANDTLFPFSNLSQFPFTKNIMYRGFIIRYELACTFLKIEQFVLLTAVFILYMPDHWGLHNITMCLYRIKLQTSNFLLETATVVMISK